MLRQGDWEFRVSLGFVARPHLKKTKTQKGLGRELVLVLPLHLRIAILRKEDL